MLSQSREREREGKCGDIQIHEQFCQIDLEANQENTQHTKIQKGS